jgi:Phage protein U
MPLMSLGLFAFTLQTAPFETLKRSTAQRWEAKNRVGRAPAYQNGGPGDDTITIDGTLAPPLTGGARNLDKLREMMAGGKVWILTAGTGEVLGKWFIANVEETRSRMLSNGAARKIAFSLTLKHYPDDDAGMLGRLMDSLPS